MTCLNSLRLYYMRTRLCRRVMRSSFLNFPASYCVRAQRVRAAKVNLCVFCTDHRSIYSRPTVNLPIFMRQRLATDGAGGVLWCSLCEL